MAMIFAGLLIGLLMGYMDVTIVSTAGPTIVADLGGLSIYAWVYSAFLIAQIVSIPIFGKLSDIHGRRRLFLLGLVIFTAGSMLSGVSQNIYELVTFRVIQGVGSGAFFPTALAVVAVIFPPGQRGRVQGFLLSASGIAFVVAPGLGSYLTEAFTWRWVFYINVPLGVVSFLLIYLMLQESRNADARQHNMDWPGIVTLTSSLVVLMFGMLLGGSTFPWYSWQEAAVFGGDLVLLALFVNAERRASEPILRLSLFKKRNISVPTLIQIMRGMVLFGSVAYLALFAQVVLGGTINDVRNVVYAFAAPVVLGTLIAGQTISRIGFKVTTIIGMGLNASALFFLQAFTVSTSILQVMEVAIPMRIGMGMSFPSVVVAFQDSVERHEIGVASSLASFTFNLGGAIGVAVLGAIEVNAFSSSLATSLGASAAQLASLFSNPSLIGQILASQSTLARMSAAYPSLPSLLPVLRAAFGSSFTPLFEAEFAIGFAGAALSLLMKGSKEQPRT